MKQETIQITTEYIKLQQLLKFSGLAESGVDAKDMILDGMVYIDDAVCLMRGKKMYPGSKCIVKFDDETVLLRVE